MKNFFKKSLLIVCAFAAVAFVLCDGSAEAAKESYKAALLKRMEAFETQFELSGCDDLTTVDMIDLRDIRLKEWDKELNIVYKKLYAALPAAKQKQLRDDERKWIKYRDRKCVAASKEYEGGSLESVAYVDAKLEETKKRTIQLAEMYDMVR